jgi:hypothetical protein
LVPDFAHASRKLTQIVEQRLCVLEAKRFASPFLLLPHPREARGGAQLHSASKASAKRCHRSLAAVMNTVADAGSAMEIPATPERRVGGRRARETTGESSDACQGFDDRCNLKSVCITGDCRRRLPIITGHDVAGLAPMRPIVSP